MTNKTLVQLKHDLQILKLAEEDATTLKKSVALYEMIADLERHIGTMERYTKALRGEIRKEHKSKLKAAR